MTDLRSADQMLTLLTQTETIGELKAAASSSDPKEFIDKLKTASDTAKKQTALESDRVVYRIVVIALGLAVLISIGGAVWLASSAVSIPEILVALGSASVGALAGLLAP